MSKTLYGWQFQDRVIETALGDSLFDSLEAARSDAKSALLLEKRKGRTLDDVVYFSVEITVLSKSDAAHQEVFEIGYQDGLEGKGKRYEAASYLLGYYKGCDAAKFLGAKED